MIDSLHATNVSCTSLKSWDPEEAEYFDIANSKFTFIAQLAQPPLKSESGWLCCKCGMLHVFPTPSEPGAEYALTVAKVTAYRHLRAAHPELLETFLYN